MRQHVPQNTGTIFANKAYYAQHFQMCKISLTFIYLFHLSKAGENPSQHLLQSSGRRGANSNLAWTDATLQASACLKLVHSACQASCSELLQQGRQENLPESGKGCARMGTSIPDWQRPARPQLRWELRRADQRDPLSFCSSSSQRLSICTSICTFCQSDSTITICSIFELLEYFLHYLMLRWENVFGWTVRCSGLLAPHVHGECCPSAFQRGT